MRVATRILLALLLALPILSLYLGQDRVPTEERPSVSLNSIFNPTYPYDEQLGMSFTQDFTSIAYNVTAVEQSGPDGPGPAYLLNGLSNLGYWYQVGLSWNWLYLTGTGYYHGFQMFYEVFDPSGNSIFPTNGGGSQYLSVNAGDTVLLSLYFSGNSVIMLTKDAYTGSVVWESYGAQGATYFVGYPDYSHGFFTGLMTEEYHSSPYYGGELPVTYLNKNYALTNAWLWIDEYNTVNGRSLFSDRTHSPVSLDPSKGRYFESNGTAEASNVYGLVTGLQPVSASINATLDLVTTSPGGSGTIKLHVQNSGQTSIRILNVAFTTDVAQEFQPSGLPMDFATVERGNISSTFRVGDLVSVGTHTVVASLDWEFYDSQIEEWVGPEPYIAYGSMIVQRSSVFPIPTIPQILNSPLLVAISALGATLIVSTVVAMWRKRRTPIPLATLQSGQISCAGCGRVFDVEQFGFCPICGSKLT